jgi:hypothetical protein
MVYNISFYVYIMEETGVVEQQPIKKGGRRSRKVNMWAKAAGEYYHSHKNDPKIKEFSDVLKSPDFKAYYRSKYGHGKKYVQKPGYTKKNNIPKKFKKSRRYYEEEQHEEPEEEQEQEYTPKMKFKKGNKTIKSQPKEENGWKWGGVKGPE